MLVQALPWWLGGLEIERTWFQPSGIPCRRKGERNPATSVQSDKHSTKGVHIGLGGGPEESELDGTVLVRKGFQEEAGFELTSTSKALSVLSAEP